MKMQQRCEKSYTKLTVRCKFEPAVVASFPKALPLLSPKTFVRIVGGRARVYRYLIKFFINVTRTRFFKHLGSNEFDNRGDRTIASATRHFYKHTIVFIRACHIAWDHFFPREEKNVLMIGRDNILGISPLYRFANC